MTPQQLDLAHEFCEHVGKADLLDYLGMESTVSAEDARNALKGARRRMQGMQSNPKYREEARLLIRNFQALDAVLGDIPAHLEDRARRREAAQLPILEMTIRGVLAGGALGMEQRVFLRNHARELGVSEATFDAVLDRLARETGVPVEGSKSPLIAAPPPPRAVPASGPPPAPKTIGPEAVPRTPNPGSTAVPPLSGTPTAPVRGAVGRVPTGPTGPGRVQSPIGAVSTSTPPPQPRKIRPGLWGNPPPATRLNPVRDIDPLAPAPLSEAATAPPIRMRVAAPPPPGDATTVPRPAAAIRDSLGEATGLSLLGAKSQRVEIYGTKPVSLDLHVRLLGELPVGATVSSDDAWLTVTPTRLEPSSNPQKVGVVVDPARMHNRLDRTAVRIQSDLGEQLVVDFEVERRFNWPSLLLGVTVVASFAVATMLIVLLANWIMTPTTGRSLTIQVDPEAEEIWVGSKVVGSGSSATYVEPPAGELEISVVQHNFKVATHKVQIEPNGTHSVSIALELASNLDYRPGPADIEDRPQGTEADRLEVQARLKPCMSRTPASHAPYSGTVYMYLDRDGRVAGVQLVGLDPVPVSVKECFYRRAATVRYPQLKSGTFARLPVEFRYP